MSSITTPLRRRVIARTTVVVLTALAVITSTACGQPAPSPAGPPADTTLTATVLVAASHTSYTGQCPPTTAQAPTFQAIISIPRGPTSVVYQWLTSDGGSTDPSPHTLQFTGDGPQHAAITFTETSYVPNHTLTDWIAVHLISPDAIESNHVAFTTSCHNGRPHRYDHDDSRAAGADIVGRSYPTRRAAQHPDPALVRILPPQPDSDSLFR
jgi:hypothetical protein